MLPPEFIADLQHSISGEVKTDPVSRILFSTDASIHKIEPLGVVFPRSTDEIVPIVRTGNWTRAGYRLLTIPDEINFGGCGRDECGG
jgi:hypothetical protein